MNAQKTILIIDDEAAIRESFSEYLQDHGYATVLAENGKVGLELFTNSSIDAVMVDLRMPEMDGLEVLQNITRLQPNIPVIVISGTGRIGDSIAALRLGAWDYILKPLDDISLLTLSLDKALKRAQLQVENEIYQKDLESLIKERTQELEEKNIDLQKSEEHYKSLANLIPGAVVEVDQKLLFTYVNDFALQLFGYAYTDLINHSSLLDCIIASDHERIKKVIHNKLDDTVNNTVEFEAVKKDGTKFPIFFNVNPINNTSTPTGFRGIIIDITNQKKHEVEKMALEQQFYQAQKMESIGRLAGGIAHDLNNLLAPIIGYSELLLDIEFQDSFVHEYIADIKKAGMLSRDLVRQLLAYSRRQTLEHKIFDLNTLLNDFIALIRHSIREDVSISIQAHPNLKAIKADVNQIEQVILNIVLNAQDAMPQGGTIIIETKNVVISNKKQIVQDYLLPGEYVSLTITDNGNGMDEQTQSMIFEPFFSTKGELGTGLGLSTVFGIVKQHNGNISVSSELNEGTTFQILLPADADYQFITTENKEDYEKYIGTESILVVEDNQQVLTLCKTILEQLGYQVFPFTSSKQALEFVRDNSSPLHALLTDVIIDDLNGKQLYDAIKLQHPTLKALYMSGYTDNIIAQNGVLSKNVVFLQKPFSVNDLAVKIREVLDT